MNKMFITNIGLEVHIELSTKSKIFCGCMADHFAKKPNTQVCPICLGLPGALPFTNKKALVSTIMLGLCFDTKINLFSKFDRKHYFYPDLPKGYQISQYDLPLCVNGEWKLESGKKIRIRRVHLEEDTAKLVHKEVNGKKVSLVDFNRSGVPLVELVTEPDFTTPEEAVLFVKELTNIIRYLEISTADMEKGSMRLEANISVAKDRKLPNYKVELKNINSFRFLEKALNYEVKRQTSLLRKSESIVQETRGYNESKGTTYTQRTKEESQDYRYFPEPDIPPFRFLSKDVTKIRKSIPELPHIKKEKLHKKFGLPLGYSELLSQDRKRVEYFEKAAGLAKKHKVRTIKLASAMVNLKLDQKFQEPSLLIKELKALEEHKFAPENETGLVVAKVVKEEVKAVKEFQGGKVAVLRYLIGQVQKELKGSGDPKLISKLIQNSLTKA